MNLLSQVSDQFENLYKESEIQRYKVTLEDIERVIELAQMSLPKMLVDILKDGIVYGLKVKGTSIIINFVYVIDIINVDDNYPYFKDDIEKGLIFATDLGNRLYYYGEGKEGVGLYIVGAGDGNFYEEATKFAETFEDFFIEAKGIDILKMQ